MYQFVSDEEVDKILQKPVSKMTQDELSTLITDAYSGRLDEQGGYPAVISDQIRGKIIVANVDHDNAPTLEIMPLAAVRKWIAAAKRDLKSKRCEDWRWALLENMP